MLIWGVLVLLDVCLLLIVVGFALCLGLLCVYFGFVLLFCFGLVGLDTCFNCLLCLGFCVCKLCFFLCLIIMELTDLL